MEDSYLPNNGRVGSFVATDFTENMLITLVFRFLRSCVRQGLPPTLTAGIQDFSSWSSQSWKSKNPSMDPDPFVLGKALLVRQKTPLVLLRYWFGMKM